MRSRAIAALITLGASVSLALAAGVAPVSAVAASDTSFAFTDKGPGLNDYHFRWVAPGTPAMWINDTEPNIAFQSAGADGFIYTVDRSPTTMPVMPSPGSSMAYAPVNWNGPSPAPVAIATLDMRGWLAKQSVPYSIPGMADHVEGVWQVHARSVTATSHDLGATAHYVFALDVTPPRAVTGLAFSSGPSTIVPFRRTDVLWDNGTFLKTPYDSLSGDSRFAIYLNGALLRTTRLVQAERYMSASVETLIPGGNVISVAAMDAAGNEGPVTSVVAFSDPDTPTVSIARPTAGQLVARRSQFSAVATDQAGIKSMRFAVDGVSIGSRTFSTPYPRQASYVLSADLVGFSQGGHTLTAFATDVYGREVSTRIQIRLDATAPKISGVGVTPAAFYPLIKDGYKDYTTMKYNLSEKSVVRFDVLNSAGKVVYSSSATQTAGVRSFRWSGQGITPEEAASIVVAKYYLRVRAKDAAGNTATSARYPVTIRSYEVVKTGSDTAKVVPR